LLGIIAHDSANLHMGVDGDPHLRPAQPFAAASLISQPHAIDPGALNARNQPIHW
jgi:hypothetical protein